MQNVRLEDIVERLQSNNPEADVDLVRRAYIFSAKAHQGQMRLSGESYLIDPLDVAKILSELRLDPATVAAGILHDTIEDTTSTLEEIRSLFGEEVAKLVDGMTKLSRMELQSREERGAQNFRKMIVALSNDIRVILINLADRLHNMRTLHFVPPHEKRARIAQETLDIYGPLAGRIGMQRLRDELEELAFRHLSPEAHQAISERLRDLRAKNGRAIRRVEEELIRLISGTMYS